MEITIEAMSFDEYESLFGDDNLWDYPLSEMQHIMENAADGGCTAFAYIIDGPCGEPRLYELEN